jgi:ribonucleoside-triphosphate reductase (thioredoxin)
VVFFLDPTMTPIPTKDAFELQKKYFPTAIQAFQFLDKYSRFNYDLKRRETWPETVDRTVNYLKKLSQHKLPVEDYKAIRDGILNMEVAPSMRLLAMAGDAAERQNISIYNCSYIPMDSIDSLVEELIIAMAGCGVGYSVEKQYVDQLPEVKSNDWGHVRPVYEIQDSTEGWADAFRLGLISWFNGTDIEFDYSKIRSAGTPLKIKGGRASGPKPLRELLDFTKKTILNAQGRKLRPIEVHDIACKVGEAIVSGGVRRTALIALFDIDDNEMRNCKNGDNITGNEQRWMANNSAVWDEKITDDQIRLQMEEMHNGQRGEPGIFSRYNANKLIPERRAKFGHQDFGSNPCGEINLRPYQFCNLSQCLIRSDDNEGTLLAKVKLATIIGTIQSMATNFPGLRDIWKKNCEEERLLGVDLNGQMDNLLTQPTNSKRGELFERLKNYAIEVNKEYAEKLGIPQSSAITCVKPNGNSGILFDCASGLHPRWAKYYVRNVRVQTESPLRKLLAKQNVPMDPENGQNAEEANTWVVHFPLKAPEGALTRHDLTAIEQCENWLVNKKYWTEHNPSVTISYRASEKQDLIDWVVKHKNMIGGMSFLPKDDAQYTQMPNEEITEEEYNRRLAEFPEIDFGTLPQFEHSDLTQSSGELACVSGACSIEEYQALQAAQEAGLLAKPQLVLS